MGGLSGGWSLYRVVSVEGGLSEGGLCRGVVFVKWRSFRGVVSVEGWSL
jgi:hypothetical protein